MAERTFLIGYNRFWRATFFVFGLYILLSSGFFLVQSIQGKSEGLALPISLLLAAIFVGVYMMPLVSTPQQRLDVTSDGIKLYGEHSDVVLPWGVVRDVRFKRVMLFMPYLIIARFATIRRSTKSFELYRSRLPKTLTVRRTGVPSADIFSARLCA